MPSIATQNIAAASAQAVQTQPSAGNGQAQGAAGQSAAEVQRITQAAAAQATAAVGKRHEERPAQIPKRTEGTFRTQRDKERRVGAAGTRPRRENTSLDVEA